MVYLTSDVNKYAEKFGINEKDKNKLYGTAKHLNRFFKAQEKIETLERQAELSLNGGAENDEHDVERE